MKIFRLPRRYGSERYINSYQLFKGASSPLHFHHGVRKAAYDIKRKLRNSADGKSMKNCGI